MSEVDPGNGQPPAPTFKGEPNASGESQNEPAGTPEKQKPHDSSLLTRGIQVVGILFSAFGGFLTGIAPPGQADARFGVGIGSFAALVILFLFARQTSKQSKKEHSSIWAKIAIVSLTAFLIFSFAYEYNANRLTFGYPPGATRIDHIAGTYLTQDAAAYLKNHPDKSNAQLLAAFGGLPQIQSVWPAEAINNARLLLVWLYVFAVIFLSCSIFSLTEGARNSHSD